jgi:hypothetical protein
MQSSPPSPFAESLQASLSDIAATVVPFLSAPLTAPVCSLQIFGRLFDSLLLLSIKEAIACEDEVLNEEVEELGQRSPSFLPPCSLMLPSLPSGVWRTSSMGSASSAGRCLSGTVCTMSATRSLRRYLRLRDSPATLLNPNPLSSATAAIPLACWRSNASLWSSSDRCSSKALGSLQQRWGQTTRCNSTPRVRSLSSRAP